MKATRIIGVLLILIMLSGIVSAAYTTYAHPAFKIRDGRDSNLVGTTLGNGFLIDITCTSNCTGFGTGTNTTDEDIRNVTSDFLVAGAGINLSRDDANDTLTITNTAIGGVSNFYLYNNSVMNTTLNTNGELSTTVSYGVDDYLLKTWESPTVNITSTGEGIAQVHIHLSETVAGKGSQVYAKWFKNVSGVETLIATSGLSTVIGASSIAYEINKAVEIQPVNTSDTFIIRLYGNITGSGGNASITIYTEGTTFSRFELPVPVVAGVAGVAGADGASFSLNFSGDAALTNNATLVAGGNITLIQSGNNITIASTAGASKGYMYVRDEKAVGTDGGSSVAGVQIRTLNTVVNNSIIGASLTSNQITLGAGTYRVDGRSPVYTGARQKSYLYNVNTSALVLAGSSAYTDVGDSAQSDSNVHGRFTISSTSVFEYRQYVETARITNGLGVATNSAAAGVEVYAEIEIRKI